MDYDKLESNIKDVLEEQQIKLGYRRETVRLYYPLSSLNRFLGTDGSAGEMKEYLLDFSQYVKSRLGEIAISNREERFCIAIPPEGIDYIGKHRKSGGFLENLVAVVARHGCTLENVLDVFHRYSEHVYVEKLTDGDFDYLVYFEDGVPDSYRYCLTVEEGHVIYHRFTIEDYEDLK